jgi:twinkle protein
MEDVISKNIVEFHKIGIEVVSEKQKQKLDCPRCGGDHSLSINLDNGAYRCHKSSCTFKGFVGSGITKRGNKKTSYPPADTTGLISLTAAAKRYLEDRGLTWELAQKHGVRSKKDKYGNEWIAFMFYKPGSAQPSYIKYRKLDEKKFFASPNSEMVLYGLENIVDPEASNKTCYIVEGEFDYLAMQEAGITATLSIPSGASDSTMSWLESAKELFEPYENVVLALDSDEAGIAMRDELARRLGKARCRKVDFGELKDANEVWKTKGGVALKAIVDTWEDYEVSGVFNEDDIWAIYEDVVKNGLNPGYSTGTAVDEAIRLIPGQLTIVTGIPQSGKSAFLDFWLYRLAEVNGWKTAYWSPEHHLAVHVEKMVSLYLGRRQDEGNRYSDQDKLNAKQFVTRHFHWMHTDGEKDSTIDSILERAEHLIYTKGINALVIDPFNLVAQEYGKDNMSDAIGKFLRKLSLFAKKYDIHLFLVAHPAKMRKNDNGEYDTPDLYNVSGSANFFNMAANGITVHRDFVNKTVAIRVTKCKYAHLGAIGNEVEFSYDIKNGRYIPVADAQQQLQDNGLPTDPTFTQVKTNYENYSQQPKSAFDLPF